jgi:hypothetical protein
MLLNSAGDYAITKLQENHVGLKLNVTYQLLVFTDDVNLPGGNMDAIKKRLEKSA